MKFPSVKDVAKGLRELNLNIDNECDIRLRVYYSNETKNGSDWELKYGPSDYDQDHRGYWGVGSIPGKSVNFNSLDLARSLIEQAKEQYADNLADETVEQDIHDAGG